MSQLILGYDASCGSCSRASARIQDLLGSKLTIKPLTSLWDERREVFGDTPPWAPTLIELQPSGQVRGWAGVRMGPRLTREFGVKRSMQALQVIGEEMPARNRRFDKTATHGRRRFLGGVAAAVAGLTLLSPIASARTPSRALPKATSKQLTYSEINPDDVNRILNAPDSRRILDPTGLFDEISTASSDPSSWWVTDSGSEYPASQRWVFGMSLDESGTTLAIADNTSSQIYRLYETSSAATADRGAEALQFGDGASGEGLTVLGVSHNGEQPGTGNLERAATTGSSCTGCVGSGGPGDFSTREVPVCNSSINAGCILSTLGCAACVASCAGSPLSCGFCLAVSCGGAIASASACCDGTTSIQCYRCSSSL